MNGVVRMQVVEAPVLAARATPPLMWSAWPWVSITDSIVRPVPRARSR